MWCQLYLLHTNVTLYTDLNTKSINENYSLQVYTDITKMCLYLKVYHWNIRDQETCIIVLMYNLVCRKFYTFLMCIDPQIQIDLNFIRYFPRRSF